MRDYHTILALDLPAPAKAVAMALMLRADRGGCAFASYERLALDTGLSRASVARGLAALLAAGVLVVAKPANRRGGLATTYRVVPPIESRTETKAEPVLVSNPPVLVSNVPLKVSQGDTNSYYTTIPTQPSPRVEFDAVALLAAVRRWDSAVTMEGMTANLQGARKLLAAEGICNGTAAAVLGGMADAWGRTGKRPYDAVAEATASGLDGVRDRRAVVLYRLSQGTKAVAR